MSAMATQHDATDAKGWLRHAADAKTVVWTLVFMPGLVMVQYAWPRTAGFLMPLSIYLAYCAGAIAHNHNHTPTFVERRANGWFSTWISIFYGYPAFAWIPTHNENHHKYGNRPGDATITWRAFRKNTATAALFYFFVSAREQAPLIARYVAKAKEKRPVIHALIRTQYTVVYGVHVAALAGAIALHGPARGLFVYASALGIPAALALWGLMFTNYLQHVDCDPWSKWDHSRNFVSPWLNWLVFDNGFHTIHHDRPGLHWSLARAAHEKEILPHIDPRLCESSIFDYCLKTYVLARLFERFREPPVVTVEELEAKERMCGNAVMPQAA